jgi:hypothetical protein
MEKVYILTRLSLFYNSEVSDKNHISLQSTVKSYKTCSKITEHGLQP